MIFREMLNSLTDDEMGMLLLIVNDFVETATPVEANLLVSYQFPNLCRRVKKAQERLSEEGVPVYESMCRKLSIPLDVTI